MLPTQVVQQGFDTPVHDRLPSRSDDDHAALTARCGEFACFLNFFFFEIRVEAKAKAAKPTGSKRLELFDVGFLLHQTAISLCYQVEQFPKEVRE